MNRIRYLAASLLCLTGLLHVTRLGMAQADAAFVGTTVVFGVIYLVIGGFLFRDHKAAYRFGAIMPLVGLLVGLYGGLSGLVTEFSPWMAFLGALDVAIVLACFYLIKARRRASEAPKAS
jgi:hypothetical protein